MTTKSATVINVIVSELETLPNERIGEVLDFVRFLKWQSEPDQLKRYSQRAFSEEQLARLYGNSADEDVQLAEFGMSDYAAQLTTEDDDAKR
jgi:hypothetical protein